MKIAIINYDAGNVKTNGDKTCTAIKGAKKDDEGKYFSGEYTNA